MDSPTTQLFTARDGRTLDVLVGGGDFGRCLELSGALWGGDGKA